MEGRTPCELLVPLSGNVNCRGQFTDTDFRRLAQSYQSWRVWQKRAFLCRLSCSLSSSEAHAVLTAMQPLFTNDLAACLAGPLPNFFACVKGPDEFSAAAERFTVDSPPQGAMPKQPLRTRVTGPYSYAGHEHQTVKRSNSHPLSWHSERPTRRRMSADSGTSGASSVHLAVRLLGCPRGQHMAAFRVCRRPPLDKTVDKFVRSLSWSEPSTFQQSSLCKRSTRVQHHANVDNEDYDLQVPSTTFSS